MSIPCYQQLANVKFEFFACLWIDYISILTCPYILRFCMRQEGVCGMDDRTKYGKYVADIRSWQSCINVRPPRITCNNPINAVQFVFSRMECQFIGQV